MGSLDRLKKPESCETDFENPSFFLPLTLLSSSFLDLHPILLIPSKMDHTAQELDLEDLITEAEAFVKEKFKNHDPSHDYNHVHRVRLLALGLSNCDSLSREVDMLVVELAA